MYFAVPEEHKVKIKESQKLERFCQRAKKTGRIGNHIRNQDQPDHPIAKMSQNTLKSFGDLKRFAFSQT